MRKSLPFLTEAQFLATPLSDIALKKAAAPHPRLPWLAEKLLFRCFPACTFLCCKKADQYFRFVLEFVLEKDVRYKTLAISCFVLLFTMFAVPAAIWAMFLPSLKQGLPNPIPDYEKLLLEFAIFVSRWKWFLAVPLFWLGTGCAVASLAAPRATKSR